ncbi:hypothetical protein [Thalassobellus suaedae]|uniref:Uncharacterized protein n=1 Tax=Thalassobellus suaedae TaxID=3074124 RepID=A0ABY9XW03_9FLAO|nr:hypothetical protein RHP51_04955 [Flavobacteriaceae bacterium HL-DH14]
MILTWLKLLLKNIKLTHILVLVIITLFVTGTHYKNKYEAEKVTSKLRETNFNQVLKLTKTSDSMQVVNLKFQTSKEVEGYIEQNKTLKELLSKQGFNNARDYKKLEDLTLSSIKYYDSLISSFNASVLVDKIKNNEDGVFEFSKEGKCISVGGNLEFVNGELNVNLTNEAFTGEILLTKSLGRRTKKFLFIRYGKREEKLTATTDCGDVKIQLIEKQTK